ncbi:DNA polymerase III subunits gamma and tau [Spiroplasma litorale]|uniref:DNA polymerase III subunit gamma/tau n=1 Tax=Spiroplasma litorale TaxID=216942 RepID=A0A0K1W035_9MOLU|nr:DNA polymerase III subunit gamma/tau [Spiroplasma litorale]AKX33674.1 DNA polymerase III subunits gamma and tau [Spiroplasma litorale]
MEQKKALYRKYRPKNFEELVGHDVIKKILINQLKSNSFSHAMIFSGQRGTGKTSLARLFAKSMQCENISETEYKTCNECKSCFEFDKDSHPDIFEIDAASNNGVDEIRSIKSNVSTMPTLSKYKVYIIDEVHMLSNSAFNALLKTLEEPPKYVIFILATTEQNKIPSTIISRCQIFNFKKIEQNTLTEKIKEVAKKEGYEIDKETLNEIFYITEGSLRDALNYLDQCIAISDGVINIDILKKLFYISSKKEKIEIIKNIINNKPELIIPKLEEFNKKGLDFSLFIIGIVEILKEVIEYKICSNKELMTILNEDDCIWFESVDIKRVLLITDNLVEAYSKSKTSNMGLYVVILGILKSINKKLISLENEYNSMFINNKNSKKENIVENNLSKSEVKKENLEVKNEKMKSEKPLKEQLITDIEKEEFQIKLMNSEKQFLKKDIFFNNKDVINELVGAKKDKRIFVEKKLNSLFEIMNIKNEILNIIIPFYKVKVVASSERCSVMISETKSQSNWANNKLRDKRFKEKILKFLDLDFIFVIDKSQWNFIKNEFSNLKDKNNLPKYYKNDFNSLWENQTKDNDSTNEIYLNEVKESFVDFEIEVEE